MNVNEETGEIFRGTTADISELESADLAACYLGLEMEIKTLQNERGRIEMELRQRMEALNATQLAVDGYEIVDKGKKVYDYNRLLPLREILPNSVVTEAFTPAHTQQVEVADDWDMRKVQHWPKRYGTEVGEIVSAATSVLPGKITVTKKPSIGGGS